MRKVEILLLPSAEDLRLMSDEKAALIIKAVDSENQRAHNYASKGMICGTISFLACVAAFTLLASNNHPTSAGVILGTGVLAIVGRMLGARL